MRSALSPKILRAVYHRAAGYYDRWHSLATVRSDQRGRSLLQRWCVWEGARGLDAGGGTGSTSFLAAESVGADGSVVLMDFSPGMLLEARRRARKGAFRGRVALTMGDIQRMPFRDAEFDIVLSTYSVCPLVDPTEGVREMYRVVRPGGLLGVAHSTEPKAPPVRWLADRVKGLIWQWPQVSLGCRSVSVLPPLIRVGAEVVRDRTIGVPLWPFHVFIVRKPGGEAAPVPESWGNLLR